MSTTSSTTVCVPVTNDSTSTVRINPNMSTTQYFDQALQLETLKMMHNAISPGKMTLAVAGTIAFLFSIDGFKRLMIKSIDKSFDYLCNMSSENWYNVGCTLLKPVKMVGSAITYPYRFLVKPIQQIDFVEEQQEQFKPFASNISFWNIVLDHMHVDYSSDILSLNQVGNGNEILQVEKWMNVQLKYKDFTVYVRDNVELEFIIKEELNGQTSKKLKDVLDNKNQGLHNFDFPEKVNFTSGSKGDSIKYIGYNFDSRKLKYAMKKKEICVHEYIKMVKYQEGVFKNQHPMNIQKFDLLYIEDTNKRIKKSIFQFGYAFFRFIDEIQTFKYAASQNSSLPAIHYIASLTTASRDNEGVSYLPAGYFDNLYGPIIGSICSNETESVYNNILYIFCLICSIGDDITLYKKLQNLTTLKIVSKTTQSINNIKSLYESWKHAAGIEYELQAINTFFKKHIFPEYIISNDDYQYFRQFFLYYSGLIEKSVSKEESNANNNNIYLHVEHVHKTFSSQQKYQAFASLISKLSQTQSDKKQKVKANYIKIVEKEIENKVKNPEYETWVEHAKTLKILPENEEAKGSVSVDVLKTIPPQYVITKKITKEVSCEEQNSIYKSLDTLYLKDEDKARLTACLDNFKNDKQLYEELGIPLKLGILLYGIPGTGKSSTINTIASYLQKDLFYVSLKDVKTNQDLKMIFDHILVKNTNQGIIVMEDIDANCQVVHSRVSGEQKMLQESGELIDDEEFVLTSETSTTADIVNAKDSELSLDFLLNLLQGSLTRDGTIFIITSNHVEKLDPALIRDGRIDVKLHLKKCCCEQLKAMWKIIYKSEIQEEYLKQFKEYKFRVSTVQNRLIEFKKRSDEIKEENVLKPFF